MDSPRQSPIGPTGGETPSPEPPQASTSAEIEAALAELGRFLAQPGLSQLRLAPDPPSAPKPVPDAASEGLLPTMGDRYRVLVEQIPAVVFMAFLDGNISEAYVSPQIEKMLGFSREEWLDDPNRWYQQIHPEDRQRWSLEAAEMFLTGKPLRSVYRVLARDGRVVWFHCEAKLVRRQDGQPWFIHGVGFDITELKQTEQALREEIAERERLQELELERQIAKREQSESRLAAIVESSEDAIVGKTLDGIITSWNAAATRLFGYQPEEIIGKSILLLIPPELHQQELEILRKLSAGQRIEHQETQRVTKSGARVDVSLTISPVKDASGRVIGGSKIARDISARKRAEEQMRVAEKLAAAGRLAATIAHEVNNPLEAVINLIYLAKGASAREDVTEYLSRAEEELERISHLTKQTLGFYRNTKGVSLVRVGTLVPPLLSVFSSRIRNRGIDIRPEIRQDPEILAVPGEMRQLVANLLSNSIDALDGGGRIRIRVSAVTQHSAGARSGVRLTLADSGPGIPSAIRSKLFEPFFTTKKEIGTGLGLWVCKSIVEKHGGNIRVKSSVTPGRSWTVFSVFLPLSPHSCTLSEDRSQAA